MLPVHHELIDEMLRALPGRRLTRIVDPGPDQAWMACNEGPDGRGSWLIPKDPEAARRSVTSARRTRRGLPARLDRLATRITRLAQWLRSREDEQ